MSFIIFLDFLWWLWKKGRLSVDVDGDGDGIMCDGSDFAHGSVSFKIEWWLALVVGGDGDGSICDGSDCAQSSLLLSLGVLVGVV